MIRRGSEIHLWAENDQAPDPLLAPGPFPRCLHQSSSDRSGRYERPAQRRGRWLDLGLGRRLVFWVLIRFVLGLDARPVLRVLLRFVVGLVVRLVLGVLIRFVLGLWSGRRREPRHHR